MYYNREFIIFLYIDLRDPDSDLPLLHWLGVTSSDPASAQIMQLDLPSDLLELLYLTGFKNQQICAAVSEGKIKRRKDCKINKQETIINSCFKIIQDQVFIIFTSGLF